MSRKIYNRLSFMAVSWLDESTLNLPHISLTLIQLSYNLSLPNAPPIHDFSPMSARSVAPRPRRFSLSLPSKGGHLCFQELSSSLTSSSSAV